jgi:hypothetical protein
MRDYMLKHEIGVEEGRKRGERVQMRGRRDCDVIGREVLHQKVLDANSTFLSLSHNNALSISNGHIQAPLSFYEA